MYAHHHRNQQLAGSLALLGETDYRHIRQRFGLLPEDRLRHVYLVGKTGAGKSTLLENLIAYDLAVGNGVAVLDPHGSLIERALELIPTHRTNDVLVFDPGDTSWPVSFNVFRAGKAPHPNVALFASQLISVLKRQWRDFWGPRLEHVLRMAILAVASHPRASMTLLYRFFIDQKLRDKIVASYPDPVVQTYWQVEFPSYPKHLQAEALSPILNKLGSFLGNPTMRNILGSERSRVDLAQLMNTGGVLLANLAVGAIGEDASELLGGLLLTSMQLAAMARTPEERGRPFFIYIDEFQRFVNESLGSLLAESRKYGIGLTLAHQYLDQLPDSIRAAVIGNVGTIVAFRLGAHDSIVLEPEFAPTFMAPDLERLGRHQVAVKMLVQGLQLPPFSARTLPPVLTGKHGRSDQVRQASRARFGRQRAEVEAHLRSLFS